MDTFVVIGLWRAKPAWCALTPAQRAAWQSFWAKCEPVLLAPARRANGGLRWAEVEEEGEVWTLCKLMPPGTCHSLSNLHELLGMSDFLIPVRRKLLRAEWALAADISLDAAGIEIGHALQNGAKVEPVPGPERKRRL